MQWCAASDQLRGYEFPVGNLVRALQPFAESNELDSEFETSLQSFAHQLRSADEKDIKRFATAIEQLTPTSDALDGDDADPTRFKPPPSPSPAGSPAVLVQLKRYLGMLKGDDLTETVSIGADEFSLRSDSPIAKEHHLLSGVFAELVGAQDYYRPNPQKLKHGKELTEAPDDRAASLFLAAAERQVQAVLTPDADYEDPAGWQSRYAAGATVGLIRTLGAPWTRNETFDALLYLSTRRPGIMQVCDETVGELLDAVRRYAAEQELSEGERYTLSLFRRSLIAGPAFGLVSAEVKLLTDLVGDGAAFCLAPGEAWANLVNEDYSRWRRSEQRAWNALFSHCLAATSSRPTKKWL
ncbi:MAG: hypothetical protein AAF961_16270, partial [Planctomycetota bacterium]